VTDQQKAALWSVAVHEAAHCCTAHLFGDTGPQVRIYRVGASFAGECRTRPITDPAQRRVHYLAGIVAQINDQVPGIGADRVFDLLGSGKVQMTDGDELAAGSYGLDDVQTTLNLVRHLWPSITSAAADLADHYAVCYA